MTDPIPPDAVEAAAEALHYITPTGAQYEAATAALSAALPLVEKQLRAKIAEEVLANWPTGAPLSDFGHGMQAAARIVIGGGHGTE